MANPSKEKSQDRPAATAGWRRLVLFGVPITSAAVLFVTGIIFWGGFNTAMEATNTLTFCVSCHEMKNTVFEEYRTTVHYQNRTGVRATCSDCHVPDPWVHKVIRKIEASRELYHKVAGSISTPEKFEGKRLQLAKNVWHAMKKTDSRECRNCHNFESMAPEFQRPRARTQHLNAFSTGQTCIDCHKGIAHKNVRDLLTEEELEELEKPNPQFVRTVPAAYLESLARIEQKEAEETANEQKQAEAAEAAVKRRIEAATAALAAELETAKQAAASVTTANPETTAPSPTVSAGATGLDWSGIEPQTITLFYPGQASFEWVQTGKDHGGARAFAKLGDRCASCHARELPDMGAKIVSGEKAEPSPIPGKRGHIDVKLQAMYDDESLHLRFQWPDAEHNPVPFVDGGKMDPDNQIKLAVMFAGSGIENIDQAGCWATCHHDSRYMPDHPDQAAFTEAGDTVKDIEVADGITKYLSDTRTKVEIKGRRGKKRGGWNKLKPSGEIAELSKAGTFMDLIRFRSGGEAENGHVLEQRVMTGGADITATGTLEDGIWTVEMSRPLNGDSPGDIALESDQLYTVGFALHEDYTSARFHHVSLEFRLGLDNPEAEINAVRK